MCRRWLAGFMVLLCWVGVANAHHTGCYYDPRDMPGYGCSQADVRMLGLMTQMEAAKSTDDWETYATLYGQVWEIYHGQAETDILQHVPLQHYQVLSSVWVGENVKFVVLPGKQLLIQDRFARPMKIAGQWTTGSLGAKLNWLLALLGGTTAGMIGKHLVWSGDVKIIAPTNGALTALWAYTVDALPEEGETEYLIHLLHTTPNGSEQVYRTNIRVKRDGRIEVKDGWRF